MLFPRAVIDGMYTLCYLSRQPSGRRVSTGAIAAALQIPKEQAGKLLQALAAAGLVLSRCGCNGGYQLGRKLEDISVVAVLDALAPDDRKDRLRPRSCVARPSDICSAHAGMQRLQALVRDALAAETLAPLQGIPRLPAVPRERRQDRRREIPVCLLTPPARSRGLEATKGDS